MSRHDQNQRVLADFTQVIDEMREDLLAATLGALDDLERPMRRETEVSHRVGQLREKLRARVG